MAEQIHLTQRSPHHWRVTFDHPPLNIFGPDTIPQLNESITALETDEQVKVVVFDSAVQGFFWKWPDGTSTAFDRTRTRIGSALGGRRHSGRSGRTICIRQPVIAGFRP